MLRFQKLKQAYIKQKMPLIYYLGQENHIFNLYMFIYWVGTGVLQALVIFGLSYFVLGQAIINTGGQTCSLWALSITIFTSIVFVFYQYLYLQTVDMKIILSTRYQTLINFLCVGPCSLFLYVGYEVLSEIMPNTPAKHTSVELLLSLQPYFLIIIVIGILFILDMNVLFIARYSPTFNY